MNIYWEKQIFRRLFIKAENRYELNKNLAQMLKGGVIMDVTTPEQARIAEAQILEAICK